MLTSFRSKLLLLVIAILVISSAVIMVFTVSEMTITMRRTTRGAARDQLHLVKLDIENQYRSIVYHKDYALLRYKEQLKNLTAVAIAHIDSFHRLYEAGVLTEKQAKSMAAESLRGIKFGNNDYFFAYDPKCVNISHPDPNLYGKNLSSLRDVKGKYLVQDVVRIALTKGSGFDSFWHIRLGEKGPVEKMGYVELYRKWNWIVGTGVYIDDIKKDTDMKVAQVLKDLSTTFGGLSIGRTGYFHLFNGRKQMLVHPFRQGQDISQVQDPVRGTKHYDDLIRASRNPNVPLLYRWEKPPDHMGDFRFLKETYVDYFPPLDWYVAASVYRDDMERPSTIMVRWQIVFTAVILLMSGVLSLVLVRRMTGNLNLLAFFARQLSITDFSSIREIGAQIEAIAHKSKDEVSRLADALSFMIGSLTSHIERLKETTAAKEKIESELKIAHDIQMSMVPHPPDLSDGNVELAAYLEPAKEVGGDFYDFFYVDGPLLWAAVGDVSGKGVPAGLFMARGKTAIRLLASGGHGPASPSAILSQANLELCRENDQVMFATVFLAVLDTGTGQVRYANAGHNPPYIVGAEGAVTRLDVVPGRPLGVRPGASFQEGTLVLPPGGQFFMYTDGVTEAMTPEGGLFGDERLEAVLKRAGSASPRATIEEVLKALKGHAAGAIQSDDITILSFKFRGR